MSYSRRMDELVQRRMMYEARAETDALLKGVALGVPPVRRSGRCSCCCSCTWCEGDVTARS